MDKNLQLFRSSYPASDDFNHVSFIDGHFVSIGSTREASFATTRVNAAWWAWQHQQAKVEELQKRVDAALQLFEKNRSGYFDIFDLVEGLEQALKGEAE